jgi:hypothetical protein
MNMYKNIVFRHILGYLYSKYLVYDDVSVGVYILCIYNKVIDGI